MKEIRCKGCNRLLGKVEGNGEIKCPRASCNMVNKFDTKKNIHYVVKAHAHTAMAERTTSSGVVFR